MAGRVGCDYSEEGRRVSGWIKLSRDILTNDIWKRSSDDLRLWTYLLLKCTYGSDSFTYRAGSEKVVVGPGQVLRSFSRISEDCEYSTGNKIVRWSRTKISRMLKTLEAEGRIKVISQGKLGSLIEITNWAERQDGESYSEKPKPKADPDLLMDADGNYIHHSFWAIWVEELGGKQPHPRLTPRRTQVLVKLYSEQLTKHPGDPLVLFRAGLREVKKSKHHMSVRGYQMPESLFRNVERSERWVLEAVSKSKKKTQHSVGRNWSVE